MQTCPQEGSGADRVLFDMNLHKFTQNIVVAFTGL